MKSREKLSLVVFLLVVFCLAHAINPSSSAAPLIVQISGLNGSSCPKCGIGYDLNFCPVNSFQIAGNACGSKRRTSSLAIHP
jgi:hypothetical protein